MLYTVKLALTKASETEVVLLCKANIDGASKYYTFKTLMGNGQVIPFLRNYGERVFVDSPNPNEGLNVPLLPFPVVGPDRSPGGVADATQLFKYFNALKSSPQAPTTEEGWEEQYKMLESKLNNPSFSAQDIEVFKNTLDLFSKYMQEEERIKVAAPEIAFLNMERTLGVVRDNNGRAGHQFEHINADINKTNFMRTATDPFFVELPEYENLRSNDTSLVTMLPRLRDIAKPYPHPVYKTPYYKQIFNQGPAQRRETLLKVNDLIKMVDEPMTEEEMKDVPRIEFKLVEGSVENNDAEIQPNEEEFRNALVEYIRYDIQQSFPNQNVDELFSQSVCSARMLEFLNELIERMARLNWMHTNKLPWDYSDTDDDDDDSDDARGDMESAMFLDLGQRDLVNGLILLEQFIDKASKSGMGLMARVEAIIKLARWGVCKPTVLKIGTFGQYLDLNNFLVRNSTGNLASMKPVDIDGYELGLVGLINFDAKYRDVEYRAQLGGYGPKIDIPVGLVCERRFNGGTRQLLFMSFIDLVNKYRENPNAMFVKGVKYDPQNGFAFDVPDSIAEEVIALRLAAEAVNSSSDKGSMYYDSDAIKGLTLDFSCGNLASLSILFEFLYSDTPIMSKWGDILKFSTKEELAKKMSENSLPKEVYIRTNIAGLILPVVLKSADMADKIELPPTESGKLSMVANIYLKVMTDTGFKNEAQLWDGRVEQKAVPEPSVPSTAAVGNRLQGMSAFGAAPQAQEQTQTAPASAVATYQEPEITLEEGSPLDSPFVALTEGDKVLAIKSKDDVIGCFAVKTIEGKKVYVFDDPTRHAGSIVGSNNQVEALMPLLWNALRRLATGKTREMVARFTDEAAIMYYENHFNEIWKQISKANAK